MKPLVSVIVPVYKVEDYLTRCIVSLCGQSLREIEIILVDDDSPDKCGSICEEFSARDSRIKVIHHSVNRGLSAARNTGVSNASCDYIMFVDGDDHVHRDFCRLPYECAVRYQADVVLFNRLYVKSPLSFLSLLPSFVKLNMSGYKTRKEAMNLLFSRVGETAWNKLYKRYLLKEIPYPEGYIHEDVGTTYKILWKATKVFYLDKVLYYKHYRKDSITNLKTKVELTDRNEMFLKQYKDVIEWSKDSKDIDFYLLNLALTYCIVKKKSDSDWYYVYSSKLLYSCNKTPVVFSFKRKILLRLFKHRTSLFEFFCSVCGKKWDG